MSKKVPITNDGYIDFDKLKLSPYTEKIYKFIKEKNFSSELIKYLLYRYEDIIPYAEDAYSKYLKRSTKIYINESNLINELINYQNLYYLAQPFPENFDNIFKSFRYNLVKNGLSSFIADDVQKTIDVQTLDKSGHTLPVVIDESAPKEYETKWYQPILAEWASRN